VAGGWVRPLGRRRKKDQTNAASGPCVWLWSGKNHWIKHNAGLPGCQMAKIRPISQVIENKGNKVQKKY